MCTRKGCGARGMVRDKDEMPAAFDADVPFGYTVRSLSLCLETAALSKCEDGEARGAPDTDSDDPGGPDEIDVCPSEETTKTPRQENRASPRPRSLLDGGTRRFRKLRCAPRTRWTSHACRPALRIAWTPQIPRKARRKSRRLIVPAANWKRWNPFWTTHTRRRSFRVCGRRSLRSLMIV